MSEEEQEAYLANQIASDADDSRVINYTAVDDEFEKDGDDYSILINSSSSSVDDEAVQVAAALAAEKKAKPSTKEMRKQMREDTASDLMVEDEIMMSPFDTVRSSRTPHQNTSMSIGVLT